MALNENQQLAIINALTVKSRGNLVHCPISGDSNWQVQNQLAHIPATDDPTASVLRDRVFPCAVLVCQTCGYTVLLNLFVLGLADEFGLTGELAGNVSE